MEFGFPQQWIGWKHGVYLTTAVRMPFLCGSSAWGGACGEAVSHVGAELVGGGVQRNCQVKADFPETTLYCEQSKHVLVHVGNRQALEQFP